MEKSVKVYIKPNVLGPSLEIISSEKSIDIIDGFPIESYTAEDVEKLFKRLEELKHFQKIIHEEGGFYFNEEWHYITKDVPLGANCHHCGVPNSYGGVGMKMHKDKPTCSICRLGLEKKERGENVRP